jgi:hypothetical protein
VKVKKQSVKSGPGDHRFRPTGFARLGISPSQQSSKYRQPKSIYTGALQFIEVGTAFPIGSTAYFIVAILSKQFLNEPVTRTRWIGVGLIMVGVTLLATHA